MAVTPADIKTRFPEFASIADSRIQFFIDDAVLYLNKSRAGIFYDKLVSLLVAHWLTLSQKSEKGQNTASGSIGSYSVGDTSISFNTPPSVTDSQFYFQQTVYGLEFLGYLTYTSGGGLVV